MGAITAYDAGSTGAGIKVAVIDSGIDASLSEFAGRIDGGSQDVAGNEGLLDRESHGTAVSSVIAANNDGVGMHGIAPDAKIISLNTASPGSCGSSGCSHFDDDIADAIDIAVSKGAAVINISLGGGGASSSVISALGRATAAGIVVVISAGNESNHSPAGFAQIGADRASSGHIIIAGAVNSNGTMASFSNWAGAYGEHYLAALGSGVTGLNGSGAVSSWSGTSFSAPVISGAVALMADAFPNLSGAQIVQILFQSATDAGAPGVDTQFGHGILNFARAFQPLGATSLAGSGTPVSTSENGEASSAMGDATAMGLGGAIILDGYSRAFALDLGSTIKRALQDQPLRGGLGGTARTHAGRTGSTSYTISLTQKAVGEPVVGLAQTGLTYDDGERAKILASTAVTRLGPDTKVAFGLSESGRTLQQRLANSYSSAFLVARDPAERSGFQASPKRSFGLRHQFGGIGVALTSERGETQNFDKRPDTQDQNYRLNAIGLDGKIGPAALNVSLSRLNERDTILGGRFSSALAGSGSETYFVDSSAAFSLANNIGAKLGYRRGWTKLNGNGDVFEGGRLISEAFSVDVLTSNLFLSGDRLGLRVMQPLRVRSGGMDVTLPVSYDYKTGAVGYEHRLVNLAPSGRELDFEAGYSFAIGGKNISTNFFLRKDPGHISGGADDIGAALRLWWDL